MSGFPGHQSQKRHVFRDRRDTFWKSLVSHYSSILGWPQLGPWGLLPALVKSFEGRAALSELELGRYRPWRSRLREKLRWRLPLEDECRPSVTGRHTDRKKELYQKYSYILDRFVHPIGDHSAEPWVVQWIISIWITKVFVLKQLQVLPLLVVFSIISQII